MPLNPPACSLGASFCSIRSSQETAGWPASARRLVQKDLPVPDMPMRAIRRAVLWVAGMERESPTITRGDGPEQRRKAGLAEEFCGRAGRCSRTHPGQAGFLLAQDYYSVV